ARSCARWRPSSPEPARPRRAWKPWDADPHHGGITPFSLRLSTKPGLPLREAGFSRFTGRAVPSRRRSADDDVSGRDPGLHVRKGHGPYLKAGPADAARDVGGDLFPQVVHDAVDLHVQAVRPFEGDHRDDVIDLVLDLAEVLVPVVQHEALPHV